MSFQAIAMSAKGEADIIGLRVRRSSVRRWARLRQFESQCASLDCLRSVRKRGLEGHKLLRGSFILEQPDGLLSRKAFDGHRFLARFREARLREFSDFQVCVTTIRLRLEGSFVASNLRCIICARQPICEVIHREVAHGHGCRDLGGLRYVIGGWLRRGPLKKAHYEVEPHENQDR